ncbi:MAG: glutamine--fructose-6-phosphate transaminase (isomerizing) [Candidatus Omnitrophica bacterium]|nr:glutamine--fructose-6-phosphate transaminase (isomerizing) [Candidatus Omnitrophota bacterium]
MCGIVGYIGEREAIPVLIKGLEHLEYRGYDSAGIACLGARSSKFFVAKEKGKLSELKAQLNGVPSNIHLGIGHTRWATHGQPSRANAHPHLGQNGVIALVHNGIIENYAELRAELERHGHKFKSQTDTEVAAHLVERYYHGNLQEAIQKAIQRMTGFFAFVVISRDDPSRLFACKRSNPLVVGVGHGENFIASDISALLPYTKQVIYLEDDELIELRCDAVTVFDLQTGTRIKKSVSRINWNVEKAQKGGYKHFMLKEIYEQPEVVRNTLEARVKKGKIVFDSLTQKWIHRLKQIDKIHFVSCGTAYHAGLVGNYMLGESLRLPSEATVSSEFRYEDPAVDEDDLVVLITQSGETADTLAALREAKARGALTLAIVNVVGSTIAREADAVLYTHAGPEIGVASTKAYLAQLMIIALFSIFIGEIHPARKKDFTQAKARTLLKELSRLPRQIEETLRDEKRVEVCARALREKKNFIYLGRGYNYPTALEGALKLKEITYAHAHGYAAGEMKHGPIALIDQTQPVICIAPSTSKTYEKMVSNIEEIRARKGIVISVTTRGDENVRSLSKYTFSIPETQEMLSPILAVVPLQLLAYKIAVLNQRDVDQPRNLAKSVTVE